MDGNYDAARDSIKSAPRSQPQRSTVWKALADAYKVWRIFRIAGLGRRHAWLFAELMYKAHVWAWNGESQTALARMEREALTKALLQIRKEAEGGKAPH